MARVSKLAFSVDRDKFGCVWAKCRLDYFFLIVFVPFSETRKITAKDFFPIINNDRTVNNYSWDNYKYISNADLANSPTPRKS